MNLPFILDVAIGLIFVYLILSLLASELQELLATVFQWRAEHLRKSIEILLAGDARNSEEARILQLANQIYAHPLIKSMNQEAKGWLVTLPRKLTWAIAECYRSFKRKKLGAGQVQSVFGDKKHSAPSYIPSDVFATTLLETAQIPLLVNKLIICRLEKFQDKIIEEIQTNLNKISQEINSNGNSRAIFDSISSEFASTQASLSKITQSFRENKINLTTTIQRYQAQTNRFIETCQTELPKTDIYQKFLQRMNYFSLDVFDDIEHTIQLEGLRPKIQEIAELFNRGSLVYQELETAIKQKDSETHQKIEEILDKLPRSLKDNIYVLANRAALKAQETESGLNLLRQQIAFSFDNSMERASGVYKRNAKGVALIIGFILAISINADAFHIVNRLSKDSALRDTIVNNSAQVLMQNSQGVPLDLKELRNQTDSILDSIALPIGWNEANLEQQIQWVGQQGQPLPVWKLITRIPGWIVSAIAISMGANFWFDLLGKIINVRNAGKRPQ